METPEQMIERVRKMADGERNSYMTYEDHDAINYVLSLAETANEIHLAWITEKGKAIQAWLDLENAKELAAAWEAVAIKGKDVIGRIYKLNENLTIDRGAFHNYSTLGCAMREVISTTPESTLIAHDSRKRREVLEEAAERMEKQYGMRGCLREMAEEGNHNGNTN